MDIKPRHPENIPEKELELLNALFHAMHGERGRVVREWLEDTYQKAEVFQGLRAPDGSKHFDPIHAAMREGNRQLATQLLAFYEEGRQLFSEEGQQREPRPNKAKRTRRHVKTNRD